MRVQPTTGAPLADGLAYGAASEYVELSQGDLGVTFDETTGARRFFEIKSIDALLGRSYTLVIYGTLTENDSIPLAAKLIEDNGSRGDEVIAPRLADAQVLLIHASPGADDLSLKIDGEDSKEAAISFPGVTAYTPITPGKHRFELVSQTGSAVVLSKTVSLLPGRYYSFAAANQPAVIEGLLFEDDVRTPLPNEARLRFLHLAPNSADFDVKIPGDIAFLVTDLPFRQASAFVPLPAQTLTFELRSSQSGEVLHTIKDLKLEAGRTYTLYARGEQINKTFDVEISTNDF